MHLLCGQHSARHCQRDIRHYFWRQNHSHLEGSDLFNMWYKWFILFMGWMINQVPKSLIQQTFITCLLYVGLCMNNRVTTSPKTKSVLLTIQPGSQVLMTGLYEREISQQTYTQYHIWGPGVSGNQGSRRVFCKRNLWKESWRMSWTISLKRSGHFKPKTVIALKEPEAKRKWNICGSLYMF